MSFSGRGFRDAGDEQGLDQPCSKPYGVFPGVLGLGLVIWRGDGIDATLGPFDVWPEGFEVRLTITCSGPSASESAVSGFLSLFRRRIRLFPRFGVEYADGLRVTDEGERRPIPSSQPLRLMRAGVRGLFSGSFFGTEGTSTTEHSESLEARYWLSPLPPAGPVRFYCEWSERNLAECSVELDGAQLQEAATRARRLK